MDDSTRNPKAVPPVRTRERTNGSVGAVNPNQLMKILTVLSLLQIAVIALLTVRIVAVERGMNSMALAQTSPLTNERAADTSVRVAKVTRQPPAYVDEEQLRHIVREELNAALESFSAEQSSRKPVIASPEPKNTAGDETAHQYRRESVQNEIDYYVSRGTISETEMAGLQMEIARLDASGRSEMLRELVRVLNSGDLKGRL